MTRVSCQDCGETSKIEAERFLDDDGVRKVRVTRHQIVHAEPLETVIDDPDHSTLDTESSATGPVFDDQVIVCTWNPTLADDLPDGLRQEAVDATRRAMSAAWTGASATTATASGPGRPPTCCARGRSRHRRARHGGLPALRGRALGRVRPLGSLSHDRLGTSCSPTMT